MEILKQYKHLNTGDLFSYIHLNVTILQSFQKGLLIESHIGKPSMRTSTVPKLILKFSVNPIRMNWIKLYLSYYGRTNVQEPRKL